MICDDSLRAALIAATEQLVARAELQWGLPASWRQLLQISCCLRGRAAGKVEVRWRGRQPLQVRLRLNLAAARLDWRQMVEDTIPHEVAHLLVMSQPRRFNQQPHGNDWRLLCIALGGSGNTRHQLPLSPARRCRQWQYRDSQGQLHLLTSIRHHRLQQGQRYRVRASGAWLEASGLLVTDDGRSGRGAADHQQGNSSQ